MLSPRTLARTATWTAYVAWRSLREARIAYRDPEALHALQSARIQGMVRHAWAHVPFYRPWLSAAGAEPGDIRTAADLRKLPVIDKQEPIREPHLFVDPRWERRDGITLESSGTGGTRRAFRWNAHALIDAFASGRRQRLALAPLVGREAGYKEAVVFREGNSGSRLRAFWEARIHTPRTIDLRRIRVSPALAFDEILARLNDFKPDVIRGIGSHLGALLRYAVERDRPWHRPRAITYGADAMPDADRRFIERELGVPVVSVYQAVEALRIGFQCERREGFHLHADELDVRVVDASDRDVAPGERGMLVLSNLTNRATVLLNYRLGDMVTLAKGPCPCGRTLPLIESIDGRLTDLVVRPGGESVHALAFQTALQDVPGLVYVQVVQDAMDDFRVRVVWAHGRPHADAEIVAVMRSVFGPAVRVRVEPVDRIEMEESGKVRTVISHVRREGGGA
jgi:phenylacetate-CoA ligase